MSITNERLRELATKPHDGVTAEERQSMAAELLAARELLTCKGVYAARTERDAAIARAEEAEAELAHFHQDTRGQSDRVRPYLHASMTGWSWEQIVKALAEGEKQAIGERDAARAEVERLRQAVGMMATAKPSMGMRADDPVGMAQEVCAEVVRLRAELADLRAYRDRTEAALTILSEWVKGTDLDVDELRRLGLARDAKGGQ